MKHCNITQKHSSFPTFLALQSHLGPCWAQSGTTSTLTAVYTSTTNSASVSGW